MSLSNQIRRTRAAFHIEHEPVCDRCSHGASLHTVDTSIPCIACGERVAAGGSPGATCRGFAAEWFDNSRRRLVAAIRSG